MTSSNTQRSAQIPMSCASSAARHSTSWRRGDTWLIRSDIGTSEGTDTSLRRTKKPANLPDELDIRIAPDGRGSSWDGLSHQSFKGRDWRLKVRGDFSAIHS